jgi:hypothetical protein
VETGFHPDHQMRGMGDEEVERRLLRGSGRGCCLTAGRDVVAAMLLRAVCACLESETRGPLTPTPPPPSAARTANWISYARRWRGATEGARRAAARPSHLDGIISRASGCRHQK